MLCVNCGEPFLLLFMGRYLRKLYENDTETVRTLYEKCTDTERKLYEYMWSPPKLPRKMRPRNMFGIFLLKNDQTSLKIWPGRHVQNLGVALFLEKNAGGSLPWSTWVFCPVKTRMACMAWLLGGNHTFPKHGFGTDWAPYGSKWSFDRLPEQEISRRIS